MTKKPTAATKTAAKKKFFEPEKPIAERSFYFEGDSPDQIALTLKINQPKPSDPGEFDCTYHLVGSGVFQGGRITGVDTVECLATCLAKAGTIIDEINRRAFAGKLRWSGAMKVKDSLGLPTADGRWEYRERFPASYGWNQ